MFTLYRISFAPAPGKLSWTGFLFIHIKNGDWARFLPVSERSCAVLISKVETHTSGKCSVILYRIAFRIGTKRYLVSSERSLSYPPLIPLASRPFFSFQIQENRVNKGRYNILFLALFCLSQCFKETFNPIRPCPLSNVTCNPYWQVAWEPHY